MKQSNTTVIIISLSPPGWSSSEFDATADVFEETNEQKEKPSIRKKFPKNWEQKIILRNYVN